MMPLLLESKKDWPPMIPSGIIVVELLEAAVVGERVPDALTMGVLPDVLDEVGVIVIIVPTVGVLTMEGGMLLLLSRPYLFLVKEPLRMAVLKYAPGDLADVGSAK